MPRVDLLAHGGALSFDVLPEIENLAIDLIEFACCHGM